VTAGGFCLVMLLSAPAFLLKGGGISEGSRSGAEDEWPLYRRYILRGVGNRLLQQIRATAGLKQISDRSVDPGHRNSFLN
jgi:hypothetical protein